MAVACSFGELHRLPRHEGSPATRRGTSHHGCELYALQATRHCTDHSTVIAAISMSVVIAVTKADPYDEWYKKSVEAFWAYAPKCAGARFDPKKTTAGECANLAGDLCSRKKVKCSEGKTDFLDDAGTIIATGDEKALTLCEKVAPRVRADGTPQCIAA